MTHSPCSNDGTGTCRCHEPTTLGEICAAGRHPWEGCCGHPLTWGLTWPGPPTGLDDWPTCWCGSGKLITGFVGDRTTSSVTLYSSTCCVLWSLDRDQEGPIGLLDGWHKVLQNAGGYPVIHATNRGEQALETPGHEARLTETVAQPALF